MDVPSIILLTFLYVKIVAYEISENIKKYI